MNIEKIKINNFKSIYDTVELDFNNIKGLWKISGIVGSGKTTIGEAIIFGLFGSVKGKNNNDLISWGQKHGCIEVWCISKGKSIYIKRELNAYGICPIYVEVDGEEIIFTNKRDAQSQLEQEYFDVSKMTVELLCIISFNNFKSLATLNTSDTRRFLDQVLGFYVLTRYSDICKDLKNTNKTSISKINNDISNIKGQINKLYEISHMDLINEDINDIIKSKNKYEDKLKELIKNYNKEIKEVNENFISLTKQLSTIKAQGSNKTKEIEFIERGICPTCGAPIDQSKLELKKQERNKLLEEYNSINNKLKFYKEKQTNVNESYNKEKSNISKQILHLDNIKHKLDEQSRRQTINKNEIEQLEESVNIKEKEVLKLIQEDNQWNLLWNILSNDIRYKILESFIPLLNKNIIKYSQRLQQPYIIQFDTAFKCKIQLCGMDKEIPLNNLSTGQLKTVDMIIILGVLGTVLGTDSCNIIFLDELFSNLHTDLRNDICNMLREFINENQTLFIISHQDLDDRYFDGSINIKLDKTNQYEQRSILNICKN